VVDAVGGSYFVESLTDELEAAARRYLGRIDVMGGAVAAIERGFYQEEIHESAFRIQQAIEDGSRVIVGVNRFQVAEEHQPELQRIGDDEVAAQVERVRALRAARDRAAVDAALKAVGETAKGTENLLPAMRQALRSGATLGDVSDVLRGVFGEHHPSY
jgi:methylmalonyl-CoA mutase, N-terminal domain